MSTLPTNLAVIVMFCTMLVKDFVISMLTIFEANGLRWRAALLAAGADLLTMIYLLVGLNSVQTGVNQRSISVMVAMMTASALSTFFAVTWGGSIRQPITRKEMDSIWAAIVSLQNQNNLLMSKPNVRTNA